MGWAPPEGAADRARDAVGRWLFRRAYEAPLVPRLNGVRAGLGLPPIASFSDLVARTDRLLVLTAESFDCPGARPSNVRYVGPQVDEPELTPRWDPPWPADDARPLVAVGVTTTYQAHGDLLQRAVDALADLPVKGFVSTGGIELERLPTNVHTARYLPHARLFALADVVVTHAGLGTVHAALAHGRPLVCLPIGRDQPDNAARLLHHGAAIRLQPNAGPVKIAAAVATVLRDRRFAEAATRLAVAMRFDEAAHQGRDELLQLAGAGSSMTAAHRQSSRSPDAGAGTDVAGGAR